MARLHRLDPEQLLAQFATDEFAQRRTEYLADPQPWQLKRARLHEAAHVDV
jgi:hypothetical protein